MDAAESPAEFSSVLNALLDSVAPFLNEIIDHLAATARWRGQNRGADVESPPWLLRNAASSIASGLAMATEADVEILRAHYDPAPDLDALQKPSRRAPGPPPAPSGPQYGPAGPRR
ncbi:hypothetical protein PV387_36050 [Streptomyces sp. ME02-6987-2C]|uniref:hypothetical protein n=1 Tax=unclassified Streptomyces TaxID=2593676 RepID=UPI0029B01325|nr:MULTISPECIES: hypothetical protein [unclassified Streptomyces]MDX3371353.1 hypothetical protein [Streptomyces sp. ME02-6987-2C]MDX3426355.1 hypothetical protein [Streptomyces sp. ME02-6985-2c]